MTDLHGSNGTAVRAGLETFGLVHEHTSVTIFYVSCTLQERAKKACAKDLHGGAHHHGRDARRPRKGGGRAVAASSTRTTTAEVSAGHRFPRSL